MTPGCIGITGQTDSLTSHHTECVSLEQGSYTLHYSCNRYYVITVPPKKSALARGWATLAVTGAEYRSGTLFKRLLPVFECGAYIAWEVCIMKHFQPTRKFLVMSGLAAFVLMAVAALVGNLFGFGLEENWARYILVFPVTVFVLVTVSAIDSSGFHTKHPSLYFLYNLVSAFIVVFTIFWVYRSDLNIVAYVIFSFVLAAAVSLPVFRKAK